MKIEKITLAEFHNAVRDSDAFIKSFSVKCEKCKSEDVAFLWHEKETGYSTLTGEWVISEEQICLKCIKCGNAWIIFSGDE